MVSFLEKIIKRFVIKKKNHIHLETLPHMRSTNHVHTLINELFVKKNLQKYNSNKLFKLNLK